MRIVRDVSIGMVLGAVILLFVLVAMANAYAGPGGCPKIPPHGQVTCAYHTGYRRAVVWSNGSIEAIIFNRSRSCNAGANQECTVDTGYLSFEWSGKLRLNNLTGHWEYPSSWLYR